MEKAALRSKITATFPKAALADIIGQGTASLQQLVAEKKK